ncbi:MAG: hypothetical protein QOG77_1142 [Solirubrobacteraceae bacterium]|nr:hypothetical protein [Solirubrobacteraceae bacterium]
MEHRRQRILLETERHRIRGTVHLSRDGYRSRVSDLLNASERDFLPLTDATVEQLDGGEGPQAHAFMAVQRSHVVFVVPLDPEAVEREDLTA